MIIQNMNIVAAVTLIGLSGLTSAVAQDLEKWAKIREVTQAWVADVCYTIEQKGRKSEAQVKGEVQAKASGFLAKLADLGVTVSGNMGSQEYQGLPQDAVAAALKESTNCRVNVFNKIIDKMLPANAPDNEANTIAGPLETNLQVRLIIDRVQSKERIFHGTMTGIDRTVSSRPATIQGQLSGNHITFTARSVPDSDMFFDGSIDNNSIHGTVYGDSSGMAGGGILSVTLKSFHLVK
jgi:hypothetical protein